MGAIIDVQQYEKISTYLDWGRQHDRLLFGGKAWQDGGYFVTPTAFECSAASRVWRDEIFEPVCAVLPFVSEADALHWANQTEYGLAALYRHRSEWQSRYQVYGPYWFALKKVLDRVGYYFGEYERPELEAVYCGRTDEETVVLAHLFSEFFQSYFFIDTKALTLSENDYEDVDLSDPDMEQWLRDF